MDNVYSIAGVQFDFGKDPAEKSTVPGGNRGGGGGRRDRDRGNEQQR